MREVNFSIPSANKASVGITTALYDRRALDCTSTLPLINSLNHLAYLTTSSARIREILTVDGGVERLVCILKNGRTRDVMDTWKWNLAFQCVVNIGVRGAESRGTESRGSENIRTRVVEADMVPVVATILDNYMQVVDKLRARQEESETKETCSRTGPRTAYTRTDERSGGSFATTRSDRRRQPPAPIDTAQTDTTAETLAQDGTPQPTSNDEILDAPIISPSQPVSGGSSHHHHHHHPRHRHHIHRTISEGTNRQVTPSHNSGLDTPDAYDAPGPSRDVSRAAHLRPASQGGILSQPDSPMTPRMPMTLGSSLSDGVMPTRIGQQARRFSMSGEGESDDDLTAVLRTEAIVEHIARADVMVDIQSELETDGMAAREAVLNAVASEEGPSVAPFAVDPDADTFNIARRSMDGGLAESAAAAINPAITFSPAQTPFEGLEASPGQQHLAPSPGDRLGSHVLASVPRDEDVILSLQLLAYVSKYCNLRNYFQQSHLVPKLKIGRELEAIENGNCSTDGCMETDEVDNDDEYCQPNDYNIFPLVEKFTVRYHSQDMRYWAGVVMRNLCRKDKARGDIRQCAYYKCGKWEEYARQFAKCRRCRQTKYCSKECQKSAWPWHRFWCQQPPTNEVRAS